MLRECRAVREARRDAWTCSTLGKIDVQGPDAVELLNRLYTNAFDSLAVGRAATALMCKPDGMVFDDGVVDARRRGALPLHDDDRQRRARCSTGMEEWLQTEWPELRVWLTSVTEQWATVAVVGPGSRDAARAADRDPARQRGASRSWRSRRARSPASPRASAASASRASSRTR